MLIKDLPLHLRPREKLLREGAERCTLTQLLTVLLGSGSGEYSVTRLAEEVEQCIQTGSFSSQSLAAIPGIGTSKAALLCAAVELGKRLGQKDVRTILTSPEHIFERCRDITAQKKETLVVFFLDTRHRSLLREVISVGTVSASLVHPREVFAPAISQGASSIIVAHNHPSGNTDPSEADREATRRLALAGMLLGIPLLDYVICGAFGYTSLKATHSHLFLDKAPPF